MGFGFALKISFELRLGSLGGLILFYMLKNRLQSDHLQRMQVLLTKVRHVALDHNFELLEQPKFKLMKKNAHLDQMNLL